MRRPHAVQFSPWAIPQEARTHPRLWWYYNDWQLTPDHWQGCVKVCSGLDRQQCTVLRATILPGQLRVLDKRKENREVNIHSN